MSNVQMSLFIIPGSASDIQDCHVKIVRGTRKEKQENFLTENKKNQNVRISNSVNSYLF